jgi:hypothetical protein
VFFDPSFFPIVFSSDIVLNCFVGQTWFQNPF